MTNQTRRRSGAPIMINPVYRDAEIRAGGFLAQKTMRPRPLNRERGSRLQVLRIGRRGGVDNDCQQIWFRTGSDCLCLVPAVSDRVPVNRFSLGNV